MQDFFQEGLGNFPGIHLVHAASHGVFYPVLGVTRLRRFRVISVASKKELINAAIFSHFGNLATLTRRS
jgi:hypothetical protein